MSKNIVVLSDGTGQDGGKGHDTNVYKLFRMLEDRTPDQIVFYDQGLGTDANRIAGMAFGTGIDKNILQCYRFIFDHYQSGDKIFLFGFSRGAATVRSLASFIHYFGVLPASRPELIQEAYNIYKNRKTSYQQSVRTSKGASGTNLIDQLVYSFNDTLHDDLDAAGGKSEEFVRLHPNQWVQIEFLGVWDTVPALGLVALPGLNALLDHVPAWRHQYHNFKLRGSVKHACHALSIDDERKWFFPSIWKEYDPELTDTVEQVWFGGSHTDVGGGFWEAGFSDIALEWMVQKAFTHGIRLHFKSRPRWNFCLAPDPTDEFHDPRSAWGVLYSSGVRNTIWDEKAFDSFGPPRVHRTVIDRAKRVPPQQPEPSIRKKIAEFFGAKRDDGLRPGYLPWILKPENYPSAAKIDAWLRRQYAKDAYIAWCKDVKKSGQQKSLPAFEVWMSQLCLLELLSRSGDTDLKDWIAKTGVQTFLQRLSQPPDLELREWVNLLDNEPLRAWMAKPENSFLAQWRDDPSGQYLWEWLYQRTQSLSATEWADAKYAVLQDWMKNPKKFILIGLPENPGPLLKEWLFKNDSLERWLENNRYDFVDFNGIKILVEEIYDKPVFNPDGDQLVLRYKRDQHELTQVSAPAEQVDVVEQTRIFILRDYDEEILPGILADLSAIEVLKYRAQRDEKKLKKLKLSPQVRILLGSKPDQQVLRYRILWDQFRWQEEERKRSAKEMSTNNPPER